MTKEEKQWLKENEPWEYDAFYGDPVTGSTGIDYSDAYAAIIFAVVMALVFWIIFNL